MGMRACLTMSSWSLVPQATMVMDFVGCKVPRMYHNVLQPRMAAMRVCTLKLLTIHTVGASSGGARRDHLPNKPSIAALALVRTMPPLLVQTTLRMLGSFKREVCSSELGR